MFRSLILYPVSTFLLIALSTSTFSSKLQTVTLQIDNMTCSLCPYTVKKALRKLDGVKKVKAKYEGRGAGWARITYDPQKTNVKALIKTTTNAGYPAHQKQEPL